MKRESFGSRLGFILISAGCAIGLGNVWRFPYIVGQYGGAAFVLVYLLFLVLFGVPIMTMEFSVGRASGQSIARSFQEIEPKGTKWHWFSWLGMAGNYLLMMFYTTVAGWMIYYFIKMMTGQFAGLNADQVYDAFGGMTASPDIQVGYMVLVCAIGMLICSLGLEKGVERITKVMMVALLLIISVLAVHAMTLPGAKEGLRFYLVPDFGRMVENGLGEALFAALGQAFFTLSIGMGSMAIFGSHIGRDRRLLGESVSITVLDTFVAFVSGLIIFPSCFAYNVAPDNGPNLNFVTLPNVFNAMPGGQIWGTLFFLFMIFAALSTVVAVFENIISFGMELHGWSRQKSCGINFVAIIVLSLPCALGFNVWSGFAPFGAGSTVQDLEDFIISNNILLIGSLVYVLFCVLKKKAWGWDNFLAEANAGKGMKFPKWLRVYCTYVMPVILLILLVQGYVTKFFI